MDDIKIIDGEIFVDERGQISSLNAFDFNGVERFYFIRHSDTSIIRGWHAHKREKKWFYCVAGKFAVALVKIDDWQNPSINLKPQIFFLEADKSRILCVPEGYANCLKAMEKNSLILVFSGKKLPEAYSDSWRYDKSLWVDWSKIL